MATTVHGSGRARRMMTLEGPRDGGTWWAMRRTRRLERRLFPVETRFFDAYCRGGARQHEVLAIDYAFVGRPGVRAILRATVGGAPLDAAGLEEEYLASEPRPDLAAFQANVAYLAQLVGMLGRQRTCTGGLDWP